MTSLVTIENNTRLDVGPHQSQVLILGSLASRAARNKSLCVLQLVNNSNLDKMWEYFLLSTARDFSAACFRFAYSSRTVSNNALSQPQCVS